MNELVYLKNDEAVCSSLLVAEKFEKRHANVMRAIDSLVKNDSRAMNTTRICFLYICNLTTRRKRSS